MPLRIPVKFMAARRRTAAGAAGRPLAERDGQSMDDCPPRQSTVGCRAVSRAVLVLLCLAGCSLMLPDVSSKYAGDGGETTPFCATKPDASFCDDFETPDASGRWNDWLPWD